MDIFDETSDVYIRVSEHVGEIVLNRAPVKNALHMGMWQAVEQACKYFESSVDIRVVQLKSSAIGVFAAGADIAELENFVSDTDRREENRRAIRGAQRSLKSLSLPTIAVIDGPCVGGGCGLALHCDFRLASNRSVFGITPAKLGLVYPLSDTSRLVEVVGTQNARRMLLTAKLFSADSACEMGLVDEIVPFESLPAAVDEFSNVFLGLSPRSIRDLKEVMARVSDGQSDDDAHTVDLFLKAHDSVDAKEGISAFLEKRKPVFTRY